MADEPGVERQFDLSAGWLALDFANTLQAPSTTAREALTSYREMVAFARQAGAISDSEAANLARAGERHPAEASRALEDARRLRGAIFRLFGNAVAGARPEAEDIAVLNAILARARGRLALGTTGDRFVLETVETDDTLDSPLVPIARSAAELLASEEGLASVRQCPARPCEWLFRDTTKNGSRRYCDVRTCGTRMRVRRHRERHRRQGREKVTS